MAVSGEVCISGLNISINKFMFYEIFNERCVTLAINSLDKNNMKRAGGQHPHD